MKVSSCSDNVENFIRFTSNPMYSCSNLSNLFHIKIFLPESVFIKMLLEWRSVEVYYRAAAIFL